MSTDDRISVPGVVKGGVVVPQNDVLLPDGAHVEIVIEPSSMSPELKAELREWDRASEEAWDMMNAWEKEGQ